MRQTDKRAALAASIAALREDSAEGSEAPTPRGIVGRALEVHKEGLLDRLRALEAARSLQEGSSETLVRLDPALIDEPLPPDRHPRSFADAAFEALRQSIAERGQDTPVTVRPRGERYELATGRRRLAVCRALGIPVLARILPLDDEAMLALQYRENEERADVSPFERGRWLAHLAERGWSTTRLAALTGLSQPSIVDYLRLGRLPAALVDRLSEPRALTLTDGRRLAALLQLDPEVLPRLVAALDAAAGRPLREQIARMFEAARRSPSAPVASRARVVLDRDGRKLVTLTRSGSQWIYRWAPDIDEAAVAWIAEQLPVLLAAWRTGTTSPAARGVVVVGLAESRGAYQSTDSPGGVTAIGNAASDRVEPGG